MVFLGTITQILIGVALGEIAGRLIFYRFKFGWKVVLFLCLTSFVILFVLILAVQIINETSTHLYLPQVSSGTIVVSFFIWISYWMKKKANTFKHEVKKPMRAIEPTPPKREAKKPMRAIEPTPPKREAKKPIKSIEPTSRGPAPPKESLRMEINDFKSLEDDQLYAIAWKEVEDKRPHEGLWARMFVENDGDENKTKVAYLKLRVEELQIQRENEIDAETKRLEVAELERIEHEEEEKEKRRRQAYVTAKEAREKREAEEEEEEKLLIRLRNTQPLSEWERDDYIGNLVLLKNAVKEINGDQALRLIRSGVNPTAILTDKNTGVQKGLSSNTYLRNIITVSDRLWKKGILTVDGLVEK